MPEELGGQQVHDAWGTTYRNEVVFEITEINGVFYGWAEPEGCSSFHVVKGADPEYPNCWEYDREYPY